MEPVPVLDHGFIKLVESWGHGITTQDQPEIDYEVGIIEAARQSTQGSFRGWNTDHKLLKYLYTNKHMTPFEFSGMVLEIQAPIFVFREWQRHRTQSYNEMSARYAPLPDLYYVPTVERLMQTNETNKQAQGSKPIVAWTALQFQAGLNDSYKRFEILYQESLKEGVPKELARLGMPVGHYSRMRASTCLRNWLSFVELRTASNAQWEIQEYAKAVQTIMQTIFPHTMELV